MEEHLEVCKFASGLSKQFGEMLCQHYLGYTFTPVFGKRSREFWDIIRENELFSHNLFNHVPSVKELHLNDVQLSKSDIQSLTNAIRAGKLSQLEFLNLNYNYLSDMEREVEALITACHAHCETWWKPVELNLWRTGLSEEFIQRCRDKYPSVKIL